MGLNIVDREKLQLLVEADLNSYLEARLCRGPVREPIHFDVMEQVRNLNRKSNDRGVTAELEAAAYERFRIIQSELSTLTFDDNPFIEEVRHLISVFLPPVELCWEEIWSHCAYGPGTVFHARKPVDRSLLHKIGGHQSVTPKALPLAVQVIGEFYPRFAERIRDWTVVQGNRLAHVPKDVKKCRQIAVEPSLNVFLQKGIGGYLMKRLKLMGLADLERGQDIHRRLVRDYETYGTIDLSDASDRISVALCRAVLPPDWFELLDACRSSRYFYRGEWHDFESFSSQGNAFTFPLETLIFKCVAVAASHSRVSVYGDDIIAPIEHCANIAAALESFGFKVNQDKSFWGQHSGELADFRESCGMDTLRGYPVRSVFFKDPATDYSGVAALANMLFEKWGYLPATHDYLASLVPTNRLLSGPRYFWASEGGEVNKRATEYSSYFWDEVLQGTPYEKKPVIRHVPQLQVSLRIVKYWSSSQTLIPPKQRLCVESQLMAFLYSGSPYSSPLSTNKVRIRAVPVC